jgi:hypothetical protein
MQGYLLYSEELSIVSNLPLSTALIFHGSTVGTVGTVILELKPPEGPKEAQRLASAVLPQMHLEACKEDTNQRKKEMSEIHNHYNMTRTK